MRRFNLNTIIKKHDEFLLKKSRDPDIRTFAKPVDPKLAKKKRFAKIKVIWISIG